MSFIISKIFEHNNYFENPYSFKNKLIKKAEYLEKNLIKNPSTIVKGGVAIACAATALASTVGYCAAIPYCLPIACAAGLACGVSSYYARQDAKAWQEPTLSPIEKFPEEVCNEIERTCNQNSRLNPSKPILPLALFLQAEHDHNGAFSTPPSQANLQQIAKTHRLAIRTIHSVGEISKSIREVREKLGPVQSVFIAGHGNPQLIQLGNDEQKINSYYTLDADHGKNFSGGGQRIYMRSCKTGQFVDDNNQQQDCLAQKVAVETEKQVWAPIHSSNASDIAIYPCSQHTSDLVFYDKSKQDMRIFSTLHPFTKKLKEPASPCIDEEAIKKAFSEKAAFLEKRAVAGDEKARIAFGDMYLNRHGKFEFSVNKALFHYDIATKSGSSDAPLRAARLLEFISINEIDKTKKAYYIFKARENYKLSAERGNVDALYRMGQFSEEDNDTKTAKEYYLKAANKNHIDSIFRFAFICEKQMDLKNAKEMYFKGLKMQHAPSAFRLGLINEKTYPQYALKCFNFAANLGYPDAQFKLGELYESKGSLQDLERAARFYENASKLQWVGQEDAKCSLARVQFKLAELYYKQIDLDKATELYEKSANQNWNGQAGAKSMLAQLKLKRADAYRNKNNMNDAEAEYKNAALLGSVEALMKLADFYEKTTPPRLQEAINYYRLAADQGKVYAQFKLGLLYMNDNIPEAIKWLLLAANKEWNGKTDAASHLAALYDKTHDFKNALKWYRIGADQGIARDQFNLGVTYLNLKDKINGKYWLLKAAEQNHPQAAERLKKLNKICVVM